MLWKAPLLSLTGHFYHSPLEELLVIRSAFFDRQTERTGQKLKDTQKSLGFRMLQQYWTGVRALSAMLIDARHESSRMTHIKQNVINGAY